MTGPTLRVLLCSPADEVAGGIPAVVRGLVRGFRSVPAIELRRLTYGKFSRDSLKILRLLRELWQLIVLAAVAARFRPAIIQFETSFDRKTLLRDSVFTEVARLGGRRVVLHIHGGLLAEVPRWGSFWYGWAKRFLARCDSIVVTSEPEYQALIALLGRRATFQRIPNPIDLGPASPAVPPSDRDSCEFRAVFAGRFIEAKGVLEAIRAAGLVKHPGFRLYVFGNGELRAEAQLLAAAPDRISRVRLMGEVPLDDLLAFYRSADVFVFPSTHPEGFPMALFFALATGLAIVSTRVRPLPEYLTEPENCLWLETTDPAEIAGRLDQLAADRNLRDAQRTANARTAHQFEPGPIAEQFAGLYRTLVPAWSNSS